MKRISLIGSTGSIGVNTLDVVAEHPDRFEVLALGAGRNLDLLAEQVRRFRPRLVAVADQEHARRLETMIEDFCPVLHGVDGQTAVARVDGADMLVSALVGAIGLRPTYAALEAGRDVALANKETLVVAGAAMTATAARTGAALLPVDSEHNAIHQCLRGERMTEVRNLWLTASGGPFRGWSKEQLQEVTPEQALAHPTWKMGPKISIDSATLMNKGLEVIEARWLFGLGADSIRVVVHPQSVVHSMVEFVDGSFKAQLGITDMRHPIQYALTWPERVQTTLPAWNPAAVGSLDFEAPDTDRFPCLRLAFESLRAGGGAPAALNAANEVAVEAFLGGRCHYHQIPETIDRTLQAIGDLDVVEIEPLLEIDRRARAIAASHLGQGVRS